MPTPADTIAGADLVAKGLEALGRGELSVEALLVAVGAPRLRSLGLAVCAPTNMPRHPELALYQAIERAHPEDAHTRYNALIRRLVSFEHELERRKFSPASEREAT